MKADTMKALIVDDEKLARRELKRLLKGVGGVDVSGEAGNGIEALEKIDRDRPDLVFLDIEMPGLSGLQVVEKLRKKGAGVDVIIVTAYDHYAVKAFDVNAVDYILKPIEPERLSEAVRKAKARLASGKSDTNIDKLLSALRSRSRKKLSIRSEKSSLIIDEHELIFAYVDNGIVTAVTGEASGSLGYQSLDELQESLGESFIRAHRKYLVNINMIKEIVPWFSGTYKLRLKNNSEIPLSRNHAKELRKILDF